MTIPEGARWDILTDGIYRKDCNLGDIDTVQIRNADRFFLVRKLYNYVAQTSVLSFSWQEGYAFPFLLFRSSWGRSRARHPLQRAWLWTRGSRQRRPFGRRVAAIAKV